MKDKGRERKTGSERQYDRGREKQREIRDLIDRAKERERERERASNIQRKRESESSDLQYSTVHPRFWSPESDSEIETEITRAR